MQKLMSELTRLYLPEGGLSPETLAQRRLGQSSLAIDLADDTSHTRAIVIAFRKTSGAEEAQHWTRLCTLANALQAELGFPAPAVSISGANGYYLWMSLDTPTPVVQVQTFLEMIRKAYTPDMDVLPDAASAPVELPPCLDPHSGKWAAFIDPGLGASFVDESGLEMPPPLAGQAALLERVERISAKQFQHALDVLDQAHGAPVTVSVSVPPREPAPSADGLLLRDATLEDIVRFLHSKNIEPTFRHLIS
ncbi:hypothetical protein CR152_24160 [Massilia violaceinigra]|uniref:Uncharacterized protein n=1 Tax=Massilia violaceinigra TaxID=2045208 RepID=A0A2D2DQL7_9BURK|nr:hypothetical protein [Massilia violaceinigra]ATQ77267.1 hypothetical protein CR152_24160 [Massilia violaceinigra]